MSGWNQDTFKSLLLPGGLLLLATALVFQGGFLAVSLSAVQFFYVAAFAVGILLGLRFRSSRVVMVLVTLLLADRATAFFAGNHGIASGPGRAAYEAVAFLLPLNFVLASRARERGLVFPQIFVGLGLLFAESVFVTLNAGSDDGPGFLRYALLDGHLFIWTRLPQLALLAFAAALAVLLTRALRSRKPVDSGFLWALAAACAALHTGALGRVPSAYFATAGLILAVSIVESSYFMAFHDELTSLPSRRAHDQAMLGLPDLYAVAAVDIDHFKNFNDTYGHDTGDEVLRMVAGKLAGVNGGGEAYRVGGEEFSILFPGKSAKEAAVHLETLRAEIERSRFRVRAGLDRRTAPRGADRRTTGASRRKPLAPRNSGNTLSVTISIGVAEPNTRWRETAQVIRAADKALYRAKQAGRNRVEIASPARTSSHRPAKRSIA